MTSVRQAILERLTNSKNAAVERVVERALVRATGPEQAELAEVLLRRNRRPGWVALVRQFDRLSEGLQDKLLENPRALFGPLSDSMEDATGNARANVIDIVRKAADPKLVFLLTEALSDARDDVRQIAAGSFLEAVRRYRRQVLGVISEQEFVHIDPHQLRRAVDFGLRQFKSHHQAAVVMAALIYERQQDSELWSYYNDPHEEATRAATQLLRQLDDPDLAAAALLALGSELKGAALAGLASADVPAVARAVAAESYRLVDPVLRNPAEGLARARMLLAAPGTRGGPATVPWEPGTWLGWLRLVEAISLPPQEKLAWYVAMAATLGTGPGAMGGKMMLVRAIAALGTAEAHGQLAAFTCDPLEPVARLAVRYLMARNHVQWRDHAGTVMQSPHVSVRRLIAQAISPGQFERLWQDYRKLPPAVAVTHTRGVSASDKQFAEQLSAKLAGAEASDAAQALRMLGMLPDIREYRGQIIRLCGHRDPHVVASAVKLIGRLEDPRLKDLLEAAARHSDPRVRANAVESMAQLHVVDKSQQVLGMLTSRFNRERANAIKAISQTDFATARECLLKMLSDPSPAHRISAMWVVGQLGMLELVRAVGAMARRDPNQHVRKHAQEMLRTVEDAAKLVAS